MLSSQKLMEYKLTKMQIKAKSNPKLYTQYAILLIESAKVFDIYRIDQMEKVFFKLYPQSLKLLLELAILINESYMNLKQHQKGLQYLENMLQLSLKSEESAILYYHMALSYQRMDKVNIAKLMAQESRQFAEGNQLLQVIELLAQLSSSEVKLEFYKECKQLSLKLFGSNSPTYLKYVHLCCEVQKQFEIKEKQIKNFSKRYINLKRSQTNKVPLIPHFDKSRVKTEENQLFTSPSFALSTSASNRMFISRHLRNTTHFKSNYQNQSLVKQQPSVYQQFYINNFLLERPNKGEKGGEIKVKVESEEQNLQERKSVSMDESIPQRMSIKPIFMKQVVQAAIRIQRYFRKRQAIKNQNSIRLTHEVQESSSSMASQEVDSINDLIENNDDQNEAKNVEFSQVVSQNASYKRSMTNEFQLSRNFDDHHHRGSLLRKIGRNSIKFVISNTTNEPLSPSKIPQRISFNQQSRVDHTESSDVAISQHIQPLYRGMDHLDHVQAYFRNMTMYLNYQNRGLNIVTIKGIETSVIFSSETPELSLSQYDIDTSRKQYQQAITLPKSIQMVILIESTYYIGPLLWRIRYDKKLFRQRKSMSVFQFINQILANCLDQNNLTDVFSQYSDQIFFYASTEYQNQEESVLQTMIKVQFFLVNFSQLVKQQNGQDIKQFLDVRTMDEERKLQERISRIKQHQRDLRHGQRVYNSSLRDIRVQQRNQNKSTASELEDPLANMKSVVSSMVSSDKLKKAQKEILISIRVKNKFSRKKEDGGLQRTESSPRIESSKSLTKKKKRLNQLDKKRYTTVMFGDKDDREREEEEKDQLNMISLVKNASTPMNKVPKTTPMSKCLPFLSPIGKSMFANISDKTPISPYLQLPAEKTIQLKKKSVQSPVSDSPTPLNLFVRSDRTSTIFDDASSRSSFKPPRKHQERLKMKQTVVFTPRNMFLTQDDKEKIVFKELFSKRYLDVATNWSQDRKPVNYKDNLRYFNEGVLRKVHIQKIYLNPFRER